MRKKNFFLIIATLTIITLVTANNNLLYGSEKTKTKTGYIFSIIKPPTITNPKPGNNSNNIDLQPICNITVSDPDSSSVNVYFYENTTGWTLRQTNNSVDVTSPKNVIWNNFSNADTPDTKYWWSVNVTDGNLWTNKTFCFTTKT